MSGMTEAKKALPNTDDPEYQRQMKKLVEMLNEGIADLKAGRVHTAEEIKRMLDERRARRGSGKERKVSRGK
jgi:hypothetical protein